MRRLPALLVAIAFALAGAGCAGDDENDQLTVFAAASLTEVFQELAPDVRFNFAGSDALATQIREGAPADVYAAADARHVLALFRAGLVERPRILAANQVVLAVPRANPARIRSMRDLARPGVKLVIGAKGVPVGDYTRRALAKTRFGRAVLRNVVSEEDDVKGVLAKVALGEADAGFVYASDVASARDKVQAVYPAIANPVYGIAIVRDTHQRDDAVEFVDLVLGRKGQRALLRAGFVTVSAAGAPLR